MKRFFLNLNRMVPAAVCLFVIASPTELFAQQVTMLEVRKAAADDHRTTVEFVVPLELQGLDLDNPMDPEASGIEVFVDDTGADLVGMHEVKQGGLRDQGYTVQPALTFGGVADYAANKDIRLRVMLDAAASDSASGLHLKGKAVLNFAGDGEPESVVITGVPVEMPYDSPGFESEIGSILIASDGSAQLNDVTYRKFTVSGIENTIVSATPVSGDDSAEVDFWSVGDNQFVFIEVPEVVSLELEYTSVRKVPVEFDLTFSVGL